MFQILFQNELNVVLLYDGKKRVDGNKNKCNFVDNINNSCIFMKKKRFHYIMYNLKQICMYMLDFPHHTSQPELNWHILQSCD